MSHPRNRRKRLPRPSGSSRPDNWGPSRIRDPKVCDEQWTAPLSMDLLSPRPQYEFGKSCDRGGADYATSTNYSRENRQIGTTLR